MSRKSSPSTIKDAITTVRVVARATPSAVVLENLISQFLFNSAANAASPDKGGK